MKDEILAKAEEINGKVTGDQGLRPKGDARQKVGDVKESVKSTAPDIGHPRKRR